MSLDEPCQVPAVEAGLGLQPLELVLPALRRPSAHPELTEYLLDEALNQSRRGQPTTEPPTQLHTQITRRHVC